MRAPARGQVRRIERSVRLFRARPKLRSRCRVNMKACTAVQRERALITVRCGSASPPGPRRAPAGQGPFMPSVRIIMLNRRFRLRKCPPWVFLYFYLPPSTHTHTQKLSVLLGFEVFSK